MAAMEKEFGTSSITSDYQTSAPHFKRTVRVTTLCRVSPTVSSKSMRLLEKASASALETPCAIQRLRETPLTRSRFPSQEERDKLQFSKADPSNNHAKSSQTPDKAK
jgi:hypothetical protein